MKLKQKTAEILSSIKLRTFHLIITGASLVFLNTLMFLLLSFFFNLYSEHLASTAAQTVERLGSSEDVYLIIREAANSVSTELSLWIIAVLAFGTIFYYIFYDVILIKFILNPLERISNKANQMIDDQNKLGEKIPNPMFKEMQDVTLSFNEMSRELETQMRLLEKRVQQRTEELEKAKQNIEHLANHDTLTGLPNRRLFNEHTSQAIKLACRKKIKFSLLIIDLDHFKRINDTFGHMLGDQVLKKVADRFNEGLRESDLICRWGGDEFAILAFDIVNKSDVVKIITRILNAFDRRIEVNGRSFDIGMSIGAAIYPTNGEDQQSLFKNADAALYKAKHYQTTKSYCFYKKSLDLWDTGNANE
jgi:diguanylate cyclase (GGDEF)-like protein